jgi:G3E family GTPase
MSSNIDVYLITGFLGSGKTTFLNRVVRAAGPDRRVMILMNEFGEIGIDGQLVEGDDADILEISKGSIFCVCVKTDFIKGLMKIAASTTRPDLLVIEATGVADPSDLKRDLALSIFDGCFSFKEQFCIIDAPNFQDAYDTFTSVEKQIVSSTQFIINKTDKATEEDIAAVHAVVARHHPNPRFHETTFARIPLEPLFAASAGEEGHDAEGPAPAPEALEDTIERLCRDPQYTLTPSDRLLSAVYTWRGALRDDFVQLVATLPGGVVRAKGFIPVGSETYLFNWVMGTWEFHVSPVTPPEHLRGRIVFIASPETMDELAALAHGHPHLFPRGPFDPMQCNSD